MMEKPDCSKGKDKRLKLRKEGGEMDQSTRKEMIKNKDNGYRLEMSMQLPFVLYHLHFAFNALKYNKIIEQSELGTHRSCSAHDVHEQVLF